MGLQKFRRGSVVHVDKIMPKSMSHFDNDFDGIVKYTYGQRYGGDDRSQYALVKIENGKPVNTIAWYDESQLTLVSDDVNNGIMLMEQYSYGKGE